MRNVKGVHMSKAIGQGVEGCAASLPPALQVPTGRNLLLHTIVDQTTVRRPKGATSFPTPAPTTAPTPAPTTAAPTQAPTTAPTPAIVRPMSRKRRCTREVYVAENTVSAGRPPYWSTYSHFSFDYTYHIIWRLQQQGTLCAAGKACGATLSIGNYATVYECLAACAGNPSNKYCDYSPTVTECWAGATCGVLGIYPLIDNYVVNGVSVVD